MTLPVTIPNTFATATASIPLSQLDTNFSTLANAVNGISDGSETLANAKITTANVTTLIVTGNATIGDASADTVTLNSTMTANTAVIFSAGTSAAPSITTTGDTNTGIFFPAADTIAFTEGGAEAMRIDSSGNVGIGTTSPATRLAVNGTATFVDGTDTRVGTIRFAFGQFTLATNDTEIILNSATYLQFGTNGSERMRIDSSGNVLVGITTARANAGDVQVSKGISFPATQSAQSDANTLDDYEQGTWSNSIAVAGSGTAGTYTIANANGYYTKIGNQVTCWASFGFSAASGGTGNVRISGLPFSYKANSSIAGSIFTISVDTTTTSPLNMVVANVTGSSSATLGIYLSRDNTTIEEVPISGISTSSEIYFTLTYTVD
jgi:hypothetical protein